MKTIAYQYYPEFASQARMKTRAAIAPCGCQGSTRKKPGKQPSAEVHARCFRY
jgi:hypothetical protein